MNLPKISENANQESLRERLEEQLRQDFLDDCGDKLDGIGQGLEELAHSAANPENLILRIRRDAHSLKGMGSSFGYPAITVVAHRMEDFMTGRTNMSDVDIKSAYVFLDKIRDLMNRTEQPGSQEIADIARRLPSQFSVESVQSDQRDVQVLSIMPKSVQQKMINEELKSCGFHVSYLHSSFEAIEIAVHTRPDLILISAVIDEIEGLELASIFHDIQITTNTPIIIVTSYDERKLPGKNLPQNMAIARKGEKFTDDLSQCLIELGVFSA